ncbi:zinc-ribbon domain-containing protein [Thermophilibacter provencensis]|uniref:Zinc-ribbon domain-containing protein n=2 Tax=Thermophilibacter provencensis TaxID=1852386 RepID=A0A921KMB4_9ACTN|nr:zinc-ribbon domain-containing protein [Thermophilibacter provencensis]HJF46133.1 zinc-ribbon domain-containing protein [Thermophilibacter provencensis]
MGYGAMREREVWWLCPECGAAWRATVDARRAGAACPVCGHATAGTPAA